MPTQVERRETTRKALLMAARELFTERGFAATGREDIAERAGVTRGALYHHFDSKQAMFEAVASELDAELGVAVVRAAGKARTAHDQIRLSCRAYVYGCADPSVVRILLTEAGTVLGPAWVRASNEAACVQLLTPALRQAANEGHAVPGDTHVAAQLLLGMLNEAASIMAASPNPRATARRMQPTIDAFVDRLLQRRA